MKLYASNWDILSSTGIWDWLLISDYYNITAAGNGQPGYYIPRPEQLSHIAPSYSPSIIWFGLGRWEWRLWWNNILKINTSQSHVYFCGEWILHSIVKWFELWPSQISNFCWLLNLNLLWHWSTWKICYRKYIFCGIWF